MRYEKGLSFPSSSPLGVVMEWRDKRAKLGEKKGDRRRVEWGTTGEVLDLGMSYLWAIFFAVYIEIKMVEKRGKGADKLKKMEHAGFFLFCRGYWCVGEAGRP